MEHETCNMEGIFKFTIFKFSNKAQNFSDWNYLPFCLPRESGDPDNRHVSGAMLAIEIYY